MTKVSVMSHEKSVQERSIAPSTVSLIEAVTLSAVPSRGKDRSQHQEEGVEAVDEGHRRGQEWPRKRRGILHDPKLVRHLALEPGAVQDQEIVLQERQDRVHPGAASAHHQPGQCSRERGALEEPTATKPNGVEVSSDNGGISKRRKTCQRFYKFVRH